MAWTSGLVKNPRAVMSKYEEKTVEDLQESLCIMNFWLLLVGLWVPLNAKGNLFIK
jgi:hypothetical protein